MTIAGFGTSTPELATSVSAALVGSPGIAVGNVVGSNIANLTLIVGVVALVSPIAVGTGSIVRELVVLVVVPALPFAALASGGVLGWPVGVAFLLGLAGFVGWSYRASRGAGRGDGPPTAPRRPGDGWGLDLVMVAVAIVVLAGGSRLLVGSAVDLAGRWGVSELVIGLTVVAVGTSAPELVTSLVAQVRGRGDLGLGNLVGSGIFNVLGILGATAVVHKTPISPQVFRFDLPVAVLVAAAMLPIMRSGRSIGRLEGGCLVGVFVVYTVALYRGWPAAWSGP
jgi:cation:H+ antiporter